MLQVIVVLFLLSFLFGVPEHKIFNLFLLGFIFFSAKAWSKVDVLSPEALTRPSLIPFPEVAVSELKPSTPEESNADYVLIPNFCKLASFAINKASQAIIEGESKLTEWDTIVGDVRTLYVCDNEMIAIWC